MASERSNSADPRMVARIRELSTPPRDDHDKAVLLLVASWEQQRQALEDLLSWFPEHPSKPEWRLPAGASGADDAVSHAREVLAVEVAAHD